jgi:peptidoglycan/xylan/chitin deacetylase (PgdA/CDA1 family)
MKTIIIRDNAISAFTTPAQLEKIYGRLWQAGVPVSLAVVPQPRGDVTLLNEESQPYDPSIPPKYRGSNQPYKLRENKILCSYLNELARQGLVELCQHGYHHSYNEFDIEDETLLSQKIEEGKAELESAFPDAEIKTFIAPYDKLSPSAFNLLVDYGFHICTSSTSLKGTDYAFMDNYSRHDMPNEQKLFTCNDIFFRHNASPEASLEIARNRLAEHNFLIISNHYWAFYYDWVDLSQSMVAAWNSYVAELLALKKARFTSFTKS